MKKINSSLNSLSKEQLNCLFTLLEDRQFLLRATVDIHGHIAPSSTLFFNFLRQQEITFSEKNLHLSDCFPALTQDTLTSVLFQSIVWNQVKQIDQLPLSMKNSDTQANGEGQTINYNLVIIPWSYLSSTSKEEEDFVQPKLRKPYVEILFLPEIAPSTNYPRQQQKYLVELGMLSASVAHDLNNLFSGIKTLTSLVQSHLEKSPVLSYVHTIQNSLDKATQLTTNILQFIKEGGSIAPTTSQCHNPKEVLEDVAKLFSAKLDKKIDFQIDLVSDNLPIRMTPTELTQVLINLLSNASDSIEGQEGAIILQSRYELDQKQRKWIHIEIQDTGIGVQENIRDKIYQPFVSTKDQSQTNAGLGLSIVKTLIDKVDGRISYQSAQNQGTTFRIQIPVVAQD